MRLILPLVLMLLGVGGGVTAGLMLGGPSADPAHTTGESDTEAEAAPSQTDNGEEGPSPANGSTEFVRLNNQFVVPLVRHGSVRSLVVMSLTLEVAAGENSTVFDREPRLRDAFLQVLFAHANTGGFDGTFTEAAAMAPLREALSEAARGILGEVFRDVLVVDITRQDA